MSSKMVGTCDACGATQEKEMDVTGGIAVPMAVGGPFGNNVMGHVQTAEGQHVDLCVACINKALSAIGVTPKTAEDIYRAHQVKMRASLDEYGLAEYLPPIPGAVPSSVRRVRAGHLRTIPPHLDPTDPESRQE